MWTYHIFKWGAFDQFAIVTAKFNKRENKNPLVQSTSGYFFQYLLIP